MSQLKEALKGPVAARAMVTPSLTAPPEDHNQSRWKIECVCKEVLKSFLV